MKKYKVAVAGATGAVGQEMIKMLESRNFPVESMRFLASERSAGKKLKFKGKDVAVELLSNENAKGHDIALFSCGGDKSREFAPVFAENGCYVVDNSNAWRMEPDIPLVVPEVNPDALVKDKKIIANPNCSTIQMVVALKPIYELSKIKKIIVATYQSVSGAGARAMDELKNQVISWVKDGKASKPEKFPYQIAFNLIPHIDVFLDNGYTKEEMKMANETKKIMNDNSIEVSATCVRVPVFRAHSESVWVETEKELDVNDVRKAMSKAKGLEVIDEPKENKYPMPLFAANQQMTYVGRLRKDTAIKNGLVFWVVSDNLLKGAALNAVEIAEEMIKRGII